MLKNIILTNIDDIVNLIVSVKIEKNIRFKLEEFSETIYENNELGEEWDKEYRSIEYVPLNSGIKREKYDRIISEILERRPKLVNAVYYELISSSNGYMYKFRLSQDLGNKILAVWHVSLNSRYGARELKGSVTLIGIIKRLLPMSWKGVLCAQTNAVENEKRKQISKTVHFEIHQKVAELYYYLNNNKTYLNESDTAMLLWFGKELATSEFISKERSIK